ncbi:Benzoate transport, extracellular ligand-binding receptor [Rubrivivax sp. A210]|uniref:ABC transporter substrate-binding protein n=1 Tax=Rubrivivax sp. A210 TaxID=2772301 RepID=UPI001917DE8F|nr:ABC transporter substrate-binding protein [Rubrivivax sp. A210]CAD5371825.1 Benzoate transport, extracellular ligand-binding receptor [Rubrivivax sp. A210]
MTPALVRQAAAVATTATLAALAPAGHAQTAAPLKVGLMLPATGTYAALGDMIEKGFKLHVQEQGGTLAGRSIQYFKVDDESEPSKAVDNVNKLIKRDQVDVLVGTVHSGVALAMARAARESKTLLIIPNAGAADITGPMCAPNIVRSSFSNWQPAYAMGVVAAQRGVKRAITITWNYAAGNESAKGFTEGLEKGGGKVLKDLTLPFPGVEFQALLTEIAAQKPDAVYAFFAGGAAVKFVKDYDAAGLRKSIPLYGPGFLTDGTLEAQGAAAQGMMTTLHYADNLDTPRNNAFRKNFALTYKTNADVYAVQGYDAAQILGAGLKAVKGDIARRDEMTAAMRKATVDSPRGKFTLSAAGNPVQDIYLRQVQGNNNEFRAVAVKALADPARGCKL